MPQYQGGVAPGALPKPALVNPGFPTVQANSAVMPQQTPGGLYGNISQNRYQGTNGQNMGGTVGWSGGNRQSNPGTTGLTNTNRTDWFTDNGRINTGMDAFNHFSDTAYNQGLTRLQPQIDQSNRALQAQLVARGLEPGTAAYNAAMGQQGRTNNDMLNALNASAQQQGLAAQAQHFGQEMQNNQYDLAQNQQNYMHGFNYDNMANQRDMAQIGANATLGSASMAANSANYRANLANDLAFNQLNENARQYDIGNITQSQGMDQNFLLGLLGAQNQSQQTGINQFLAQQGANNNWYGQGMGLIGQAPQPQFTPTSGMAQGMMQAGNNMAGAAANQNQAMGQMLGAGLSLIPGMPSDRRLKENIEYITTVNDVKVYEFDYIDKRLGKDRYRGVMAQEIMNDYPDAVNDFGGFYVVDYNKLPVNMEIAS